MKSRVAVTVAILFIALQGEGMNLITPALQTIATAFPSVPFSSIVLVVTITNLVLIPISLLIGVIDRRIITSKNLAIIGLVLFVVAGAAPYFLTNFAAILVARGFYGIGLALCTVLPASLMLQYFKDSSQARLMGYATATRTLGGVVSAAIGGVLAVSGWQYAFLGHLIAIPSLIAVVIWLPRDELPARASRAERAGRAPAERLPASIYLVAVVALVMALTVYPILTFMSTIIADQHLGNAATAGLANSIFAGGGVVAGLLYPLLKKLSARYVITLGFVLLIAGQACMISAASVAMLIAASALAGIAFGVILTEVFVLCDQLSPNSRVSMGVGLAVGFMNIGAFASAYLFTWVMGLLGQSDLRLSFVTGVVINVVVATAFTLVVSRAQLKPPAPREETPAPEPEPAELAADQA